MDATCADALDVTQTSIQIRAGSILRIFWTPQHSPTVPPLPLEVSHINPARVSGGAVSSTSGVWGGAPAEIWILVHFSLKI